MYAGIDNINLKFIEVGLRVAGRKRCSVNGWGATASRPTRCVSAAAARSGPAGAPRYCRVWRIYPKPLPDAAPDRCNATDASLQAPI